MRGIRDLLAFQYWLDNGKMSLLEASLLNAKEIPRERAQILRELEVERSQSNRNGSGPIGDTAIKQ